MANVCKAQDVVRCCMCCSNGEFRCYSCSTILCEACVGKHMSSRVSHDVKSLFFKNHRAEFPICSLHENHKCEMFCQTCRSSICCKCITSGKHRSHEVKEFVECLMERKTCIEKAKLDVRDIIIPIFEKMKDQVEDKLKILYAEVDSIEENIYKNRDKWKRLLDAVVEDTINDARKMKSCIQKDLINKQDHLQNELKRLNEYLQSLTEVLEAADTPEIFHYNVDFQHLLQNAVKIQIKSPIFCGKIISEEELKGFFGEMISPVKTTLEWPKIEKDKMSCIRSNHLPAFRRKDLKRFRYKSFSDSEEDVESSWWNQAGIDQELSESVKSNRRHGFYQTPARGGAGGGFQQRFSDSNLYKGSLESTKENRSSVSAERASTLPAGGIKHIFPRSPSMICIDDVIEFTRNNGLRCSGIVKYVGNLKDLAGIFVGVELDAEEDGKHDGIVNGVRYFKW
ncbi:E3 ubiquitin-protein ligase Trim36-like [Saccostrea echinata]|uniref:E3 ubiquitin-protein ligase Trim36-like n=1 Tax=Saccostrea echinata TaxID=191078 RepID=UPI002A83C1F2|nr:E3 ubiquitin-protein ligase Trim36-like [Saccostrea echinata]